MLYDISSVLKNADYELTVEGKPELADIAAVGAEPVITAASFAGKIVNVGGALEFSAAVCGSLAVKCARCARDITRAFKTELTELLVSEDSDALSDRDDVTVFSGHTVDLDELVMSNIWLSFPGVFLCKSDCKGICQDCGKDLNEGGCDCAAGKIDPRWEPLRELLKQEKTD